MNIKQKQPNFKLARGLQRLASKVRSIVPAGHAITSMSPIISTDVDYDLTPEDGTLKVDTTGGNILVNLPSAAGEFIYDNGLGRVFIIKRITAGVNTLDITPDGAETIDGAASYSLTGQYDFVVLQSDGANWMVIGYG